MTRSSLLSHLEIAHLIWEKHLKKNSMVVDATCGNGHDSYFLANILTSGHLYCIDVQQNAIENTKKKLEMYRNISFIQDCHSNLEKHINHGIDLIVYNLGYLPGSDKTIKTLKDTTITSLKKSLSLLNPNGLITITSYPGHFEGKEEKKAIYKELESIDNSEFSVYCYHSFFENAPSIFFVSKKIKKID